MRASMKFRAKRYVTTTGSLGMGLVSVSATDRGETFGLCLSQFRQVFGFTPRRGVAYQITMTGVEIEALS